MTVPVGTGGPETPLNYTIWGVVCGVIAVGLLLYGVGEGLWPAFVPGGVALFAAVGCLVKAARLRRHPRDG